MSVEKASSPKGLQPQNYEAFLKRHLKMSSLSNEKQLRYSASELIDLCGAVKTIIMNEPMLGSINPPVVVVGDIHGQYYDLLRMFALFKTDELHGAIATKYIFLGDYVDRGRRSIECISLLFILKILFPNKYLILRGNHEIKTINREYGFLDEIRERFPVQAQQVHDCFNDCFSYLPVAGLIGKKILCMHGGLSSALTSLDDIRKIPRPLENLEYSKLARDLLWSDPVVNATGFHHNRKRGCGEWFGEDTVKQTCDRLKINMILRAHQVMAGGYGFFANRQCVTIFTAPRYGGARNKGSVMTVTKHGRVGFKILRPIEGVVSDAPQDSECTVTTTIRKKKSPSFSSALSISEEEIRGSKGSNEKISNRDKASNRGSKEKRKSKEKGSKEDKKSRENTGSKEDKKKKEKDKSNEIIKESVRSKKDRKASERKPSEKKKREEKKEEEKEEKIEENKTEKKEEKKGSNEWIDSRFFIDDPSKDDANVVKGSKE